MKLGIIGLPNSGKTTIFNALTRGNYETSGVSSGQFEVNTATINVPDTRIDLLSAMYKPEKTIYAQVTYADIGGLDKGINESLAGPLRNQLAEVDGFLHVVRAFENDRVPHPPGDINPQRDIATLDSEFLLVDLVTVETRLERLENEIKLKGKRVDKSVQDEVPLMERLKAHLEQDKPLRELNLSSEEIKQLRGFGFLTMKPVLVVLNMGDDVVDVDKMLDYSHPYTAVIGLQGALEAELAQLDADDAELFMDEYGITELSASKVVRLSYELLHIQSFFTVGEDEVRAWSVPIGVTAPEAAGAIHSDLQKGFIRAEVMRYDELLDAGNESALKSTGKVRLEGKEYIVSDGDILHIRHS